MQLPRGKYRSIKKGAPLGEILDEMIKSRFSGICLFSSDAMNGTVVFRNGIVVLAKVQNHYGDPAWHEAGLFWDNVCDAVLSDLDNAQIQLALEFNKKAYVQNGTSHLAVSRQIVRSDSPVQQPSKRAADPQHLQKEREFIKIMPVPPVAPAFPADVKKKPAAEALFSASEPARQDSKATPEPERSIAEKEMDNFDAMDLDDVTQKIRKDCKIILKQLQLDHLEEK
jgi:hypothetical protein